MDVAVTGAAGEVGRIAIEAFPEDTVHAFTHDDHDDLDSTVLEMTNADAFDTSLVGMDALVHLAWGPADPDAWNDDHEANVRGTYNALEAARRNDLDRVVLASSIHAVGMYDRDDPSEVEDLAERPETAVEATDPPRPDSYYGVAKVTCEALGSFYADRHGLDVVSLRIGWVMTESELREAETFAPGRRRYARAMWLSPRDCRNAIERSVNHPLAHNPVVGFVTSANDDRVLSLAAAMVHLDFRPRDNSARVLGAGTERSE